LVDREIVATRLSKLRDALRRLRSIARKPRQEYLESETDTALSEHFLRIALEAALDVGNHVIAAEGYRKPQHMREIPLILSENGVIARDLAVSLARATGLRNRLVHLYADIDHAMIHEVLQTDLGDLEDYAVAIGAFCSKRG
jgi:uncharacterized protein YutE (UPF0331/DUF86 family)